MSEQTGEQGGERGYAEEAAGVPESDGERRDASPARSSSGGDSTAATDGAAEEATGVDE